MSKLVRLCYCQDCVQEVRGDDSQFPQVLTANEHVFPKLTADGHVQGGLNVVGANPCCVLPRARPSLFVHARYVCMLCMLSFIVNIP